MALVIMVIFYKFKRVVVVWRQVFKLFLRFVASINYSHVASGLN